jgi:CheY-like chemotaxis protein
MARILIIEDRPLNRKLLASLLTLDGHEVVAASDGHEALGLLAQVKPDLVISDLLHVTAR